MGELIAKLPLIDRVGHCQKCMDASYVETARIEWRGETYTVGENLDTSFVHYA